MLSCPTRQGNPQLQTRWPPGLPASGTMEQTPCPAFPNHLARSHEAFVPFYENVCATARPSIAVPTAAWQPVSYASSAYSSPALVAPHPPHFQHAPAVHAYPAPAVSSRPDLRFEPRGFTASQPRPVLSYRQEWAAFPVEPNTFGCPRHQIQAPFHTPLPIASSPVRYNRIDSRCGPQLDVARFPEAYPAPTPDSRIILSPHARPGVDTGSAPPSESAPKKKIVLKFSRKHQVREPEPGTAREAKRSLARDDPPSTWLDAHVDNQDPVNILPGCLPGPKPNVALADHVRQPQSSLCGNPQAALVIRGKSSDGSSARLSDSSSNETRSDTQPLEGHWPAESSNASIPSENMARTRQMPNPPSEKDEGSPKTPHANKPLGNLHFSPRLYGREQPKRAATKRYRDVATPRKASGGSKTSLDLNEDRRPHQSHFDGASQIAIQTTATKRKRQGTAHKALAPKKQRHDVEAPQNPALCGMPPVTRCRATEFEQGTGQQALPQQPETYLSAKPPVYGIYCEAAPVRDKTGDEEYVKAVISSCEEHMTKTRVDTVYTASAFRVSDILRKAKYASEDEAKFLTKAEAEAETSANSFFDGPIVTEGQQTLPLQTPDQFLGEYYEPDAKIHIQDSSVRIGKTYIAVRPVKVDQVRERLAAGLDNTLPWNCLELATHHCDGLRPNFLQNEDCRLLTKLKIPDSADEARRKTYSQGYKEIETWALLAQAGALTEPHQDSHGYSTFITINQGKVGFGWLSNPSKTEREGWRKNPQAFSGGRWRYVVLKPGQTIYFPAGTVHTVFRLRSAGHTLAFGGHVLRCSNIVHWVKTLLEERDHPNVTNEDLLDSSHGYLARVERFVNHALKNGTAEKWGGRESIERFLELKKEFFRKKQKQRKHG